MVKKRRRGTAIVETRKGILVTAGRSKCFLLPGGGANRGESRRKAAIRELREETGLRSYSAKYLFKHIGEAHKSDGHGYFKDHHSVFLIEAHGNARPRHEIKHIAYYKPGSEVGISAGTRSILERFFSWKMETINM